MKHLIRYTALSLLLVLALSLASCGAPELESVKPRFAELIEASYELNEIFFGAGLETYARDGEFATEHRIYDDVSSGYDNYELVKENLKYFDAQAIMEAAEKVYSADYLDGIYTMAFDGYADSTTGVVTTARYLMDGTKLLRYSYGNEDSFDILRGKQRRYDLDSMKITRPSRANFVSLSIDSYLIGDEDNILNVTLRFVLQDGEWYLDSPTY